MRTTLEILERAEVQLTLARFHVNDAIDWQVIAEALQVLRTLVAPKPPTAAALLPDQGVKPIGTAWMAMSYPKEMGEYS